MKKLLVIGDEHGRGTWKYQLLQYPIEEYYFAFVGDYVDSYELSDTQITKNLQEIIQFKKDNPKRVFLCLGNHDFSYMFLEGGYFRCSGFRPSASILWNQLFNENKDLFQMALQVDSTLISHAGVTDYFIKQFNVTVERYEDSDTDKEKEEKEVNVFKMDITNVASVLNKCLRENVPMAILEKIGMVGKVRGDYRHATGGPIWADFSEMKKAYAIGIERQIFGHTYKNSPPENIKTFTGETLMRIDCGDVALKYPTIIDFKSITK